MATFEVVDLTRAGQARGPGGALKVGDVDTADLASDLAAMRDALTPLLNAPGDVALKSVVFKLAISVEGKIAFIAKGTVDASVEVTFERSR